MPSTLPLIVPTPAVSIVVPVFKEEMNITPFVERTVGVMDRLGLTYEIVFALDPSPDDTEEIGRAHV